MLELARLLGRFFWRQSRGDQIGEQLRNQPLMKEYWRAERAALAQVFGEINDPTLNSKIDQYSESNYRQYQSARQIPRGQEEAYQALARENAMRLIFDTNFDLQEEVGQRMYQLWADEMSRLGVYDKFRRYYVDPQTGISKFITTNPIKPY